MSEPRRPVPVDPPYVLEGARSSRAKCRTCGSAIEKGTLRLGTRTEGTYGASYVWQHLTCAARETFAQVEEAWALEAWRAAQVVPTDVPTLDELRGLRASDPAPTRRGTALPFVDRAPTGRTRCKHCGDPIAEGDLRLVLARQVPFGDHVRTVAVHVLPEHAGEALADPACGTPRDGIVAALRENTLELGVSDVLEAVRRGGLEGC